MESPRLSSFPHFLEIILPYVRRKSFLIQLGSFSLALLLGRVELLYTLLPFGVAFLAAMDMAGQNVYYPFAGVVIGSLIAGEAGYAALVGSGLYMAAVFVYRLLKRRAKRADKLILLGFTQLATLPLFYIGSFSEALHGLAGLALILLFATAFQNGLRALKSLHARSKLHEEEQIALCLLLGAAALAVSDVSMNSFSLGVVLVAWVSMFVAYAKGLPAVAGAVVLGGMLILGGRAQPLLLANLAVCTMAGVVCRRMGLWGVMFGFCAACAVTEGYIGVGGLQVSMANAIPAAAALALIPRRGLLWLRSTVDAGAREERTARASLSWIQARAAADMTDTARTVEQVASLFPEQAEWAYDAALERADMAAAAQNICADCTHRGACWRDSEAMTDAVAAMLPAHSNGMRPRPQKPIPGDCMRTASVAAAAAQALDAYRRRCTDAYRAASQQAFAHRQLAGVSRTILSLSQNVRDREWPIEGAAQMLCRRLEREGYRVRGALVNKRKGCLQAQLKMAEHVSNAAALEDAVSRAVECPMRMLTRRDGEYGKILEFEQARRMKAALGAATLPMRGSIASGDSTAHTSLPDGRALFALSDGMGSGSAARAQSTATLDMLCRLYETGFDRDTALECVNRLLMQHGGQDMYATVDALHVNLANGAAEFIKFGAPPSFVLREGQVHTVYAEALPAGILDEAAPAVHAATLRRNDSVVLLTDGALDALGEDTAQEILSCVGGANTCEEAARSLLAAARERGHTDDMSVLVVRME